MNSQEEPLGLSDFAGGCFGLVMDDGGGCRNFALQIASLIPYHIGPCWDDPHHWNRLSIRVANKHPKFKAVLDELSAIVSFVATPRRCVILRFGVCVCHVETLNAR